MFVESIPRRHVAGGHLLASVRSAANCIARCVNQRRRRRRRSTRGRGGRRDDRCVAVDFDTSNNTCWLHSATTGCVGDHMLFPLDSSTHYRVRRHACDNLSQSLNDCDPSCFIQRRSQAFESEGWVRSGARHTPYYMWRPLS